jgi:hypothetical protein
MLESIELIEIYNMLNHVHHIIDHRDWPSLKEVFSDDAVYDLSYRNLPPAEGRDAIGEMMAASYTRDFDHLLGHHNMNFWVHEDPDGVVRADSKVICVMADGTSTCADFQDDLVKTAEGWRIKRRVATTRDPKGSTWTRAES